MSGRRAVVTIFRGKISLQIQVNLHLPIPDWGASLCFSPSWTKAGGCRHTSWFVKGWALLDTLIHSSFSARNLKTWLCLHMYLPWVRLVLQPTRICISYAGTVHRGQAGSFPSHCCRYVEDGSTSYVAWIMEVSPLDSKLQNLLHVSFLFLTLLSHPAALFGLCYSPRASSCFLLSLHLLHHHDSTFSCRCLLPERCGTRPITLQWRGQIWQVHF